MRSRAAYTLLEVIVALAIGLVLVAALYVAMDVEFRTMQGGRDVVMGGQLARGLFGRMAADVRESLALLPSTAAQQQKALNAASSTSSSSSSSTTAPPGQFSAGIVGSESQIMLFLTKAPRYNQAAAQSQSSVSDVRQISYSLMPSVGLARHQYRSPTGTVTDGTSFTGSVEEIGQPEILASEVIDLRFRYFDPTATQWTSSWDGTTMGPPQAVEITMAILPSILFSARGTRLKPPTYYRSVVAIPTATIPQAIVDQQAGVTQ
jgi:prepilin-type N-terminal cleavage/methylation domain-containing protein